MSLDAGTLFFYLPPRAHVDINSVAQFLVTTTQSNTIARCTGPGLDATVTLGRSGTIDAKDKREGDGKTPLGTWILSHVLYRPDREKAPITKLPVTPLSPDYGWCDDPEHPSYNKMISQPFTASHESLWRDDSRYDLIVTLDHNTHPVRPYYGSAIFLHVMAPEQTPTEGCIGFQRHDLLSLLLRAVSGQTTIEFR